MGDASYIASAEAPELGLTRKVDLQLTGPASEECPAENGALVPVQSQESCSR